MLNNKKYWILGIVILIVIILGIIVINYSGFNGGNDLNNATSTAYLWQQVKAPELDRKFVIPEKYNSDIQGRIRAGVASAKEKIVANSKDVDAWFNLAVWYKMANDYKGAEEIWVFISKVEPKNRIASSNLGDLYTNFIKDYTKAEEAWLKVVEIDPMYVDAYTGLYVLYKNYLPEKVDEAPKILKTGIDRTKSATLMVDLARYYVFIDNKAKAIQWFKEAKIGAQRFGDSAMVKSVEEEISALKR